MLVPEARRAGAAALSSWLGRARPASQALPGAGPPTTRRCTAPPKVLGTRPSSTLGPDDPKSAKRLAPNRANRGDPGEVSPLLTGGGVTDPFSPPPAAGGDNPGPIRSSASATVGATGALSAPQHSPPPPPPAERRPPPPPPDAARSFQPHFSGPERLRVAAAPFPPAGSTAASAKGHQVGGGHVTLAPPPPTRRSTQSGETPLTQWRTRVRRFPHRSPHCRSGGSTAGPARKRPSPLRLVPLGRCADTGGGPVGEDTDA